MIMELGLPCHCLKCPLRSLFFGLPSFPAHLGASGPEGEVWGFVGAVWDAGAGAGLALSRVPAGSGCGRRAWNSSDLRLNVCPMASSQDKSKYLNGFMMCSKIDIYKYLHFLYMHRWREVVLPLCPIPGTAAPFPPS